LKAIRAGLKDVGMKPAPFDLLLSSASALGMIAVAIAAVLAFRRRGGAWAAFGFGALAWTVGVAAKIAWAVPTNKPVLAFFAAHLGPFAGPVSWLYIGLLTGVFEVGATWIFVRATRIRTASRADANAFGVGFGGVEAALLGLLALALVAVVALFWDRLPAEARTALAGAHASRWTLVLPIVERAYCIVAHAVSCILVVEAVQQKRSRWLATSFAYKTLVDGIAAWGIMAWNVKTDARHFVAFELALCALVIASLPLVRIARVRETPAAVGDACLAQ
jgi:uncharacterized membrane protein YhfC